MKQQTQSLTPKTPQQTVTPTASMQRITSTTSSGAVLRTPEGILGLQRTMGNRAMQRQLQTMRQPPTRPVVVQRFKDASNTEVDCATVPTPEAVIEYIDQKEKGKITLSAQDVTDLVERLKALVATIPDATKVVELLALHATRTLIKDEVEALNAHLRTFTSTSALDANNTHDLLEKHKANLPTTSVQLLEDHLDLLKYKRGREVHEAESNWPPTFVEERDAYYKSFNARAKKTLGTNYEKRSQPEKKRVALGEGLSGTFKRRGSVDFNLEGGYDSDTKRQRRDNVRLASGKLDADLRASATKADNLYADQHPGEKGYYGTDQYKQSAFKYQYEGIVGTYDQLKSLGPPDFFEYDHQPQHDIIEKAARLSVAKNKKIIKVSKDHSSGGLTIVLAHSRHAAGASYGKATPYESELDTIGKSGDDAPTQITKIKAVLKKATIADADEMLAVYAKKANYADVDEAVTDPIAQDKLKNEIEERVKQGEVKMKAQTFDDWF